MDIVRHRVPGLRAPFVLVLQHHDISASTRIVAPVTVSGPTETAILSPEFEVNGRSVRARMLDITAVPRSLLLETVGSAQDEADAILNALDIILQSYPIGRPR